MALEAAFEDKLLSHDAIKKVESWEWEGMGEVAGEEELVIFFHLCGVENG